MFDISNFFIFAKLPSGIGLISLILLFDKIKISKSLNLTLIISSIESILFEDKSRTFKSKEGILFISFKDVIPLPLSSSIINDLK